jgi:hypothetical protein
MVPFAVSTAVQIAYVIALVVVLFVGPSTVAEMKGQEVLASSSWLTMGVGPWIGAFRLATPGSWWARHFYGQRKMEKAEERYGEDEFA